MLEAAFGFPSFRHYCATILQHWRSDRTGWHLQEEVWKKQAFSEGTSQVRKRSLCGVPVPTLKWG